MSNATHLPPSPSGPVAENASPTPPRAPDSLPGSSPRLSRSPQKPSRSCRSCVLLIARGRAAGAGVQTPAVPSPRACSLALPPPIGLSIDPIGAPLPLSSPFPLRGCGCGCGWSCIPCCEYWPMADPRRSVDLLPLLAAEVRRAPPSTASLAAHPSCLPAAAATAADDDISLRAVLLWSMPL